MGKAAREDRPTEVEHGLAGEVLAPIALGLPVLQGMLLQLRQRGAPYIIDQLQP